MGLLPAIAPSYMHDLIHEYIFLLNIFFVIQSLLSPPSVTFKSYGDCSFKSFSTLIWNGLPNQVTEAQFIYQFRSLLKTHTSVL